MRQILILISLLVTVSGCIGLPVNVPEAKPFKEEAKNLLVTGKTTRLELESNLGDPLMGGEFWSLYRDTREGWRWFFCYGAAYSGGCGATDRGQTDYYLYVDYVDNVVTSFDIQVEDELCDAHQLCFWRGLLMQADRSSDNSGDAFAPPVIGCKIFLYSDSNRKNSYGEIEVDGWPMGAVVGPNAYYSHIVSSGFHVMAVLPTSEMMNGASAAAQFNCENQQAGYFRYGMGLFSPKLTAVDEPQGQADVRARWRAKPGKPQPELTQANWIKDDEIFVTRYVDAIRAYRIDESGKVKLYKLSETGEFCGLRAAMVDYGLVATTAADGIAYSGFIFDMTQIRVVCSRDGNCQIASIIDGDTCEIPNDEEIRFWPSSRLLVIEPDGDSYTQLFFGKPKFLKKHADCKHYSCSISVNKFRTIVAEGL